MKKYCILFFLLLTITSCHRITDETDKAALKKHFEIPDDAEMIAYDGYPARVGFGQREGLTISARYRLTDEDMNSWIKSVQPKGLKELPISPECRSKLWFEDKLIPLDTQTGYYFCRTVGDEVLNAAKTKPCDEVDNLIDAIFAILNTEKKELSVIVTSRY